jgi:hypothetical protein
LASHYRSMAASSLTDRQPMESDLFPGFSFCSYVAWSSDIRYYGGNERLRSGASAATRDNMTAPTISERMAAGGLLRAAPGFADSIVASWSR